MRVSRAIALYRPELSSLRILMKQKWCAAAAASRDGSNSETPLIQMAHDKSTVIQVLKETMNGAQSSHFFDVIIY